MTKPSIAKSCSIDGCSNPHYGRGFCKYHYQQQRKTGNLLILPKVDPILRFWSRVDKNGSMHPTEPDLGQCWEWQGCTNGRSYGQYRLGKKCWGTHRYAWTITFGEIPDGLGVLHNCDNPSCVNPEHLFLGTQLDNMKDRDNKSRQPRGERLGTSKLTDEDVRYIRWQLDAGLSPYRIAKTSKVTSATIYSIKKGETWTHIT